METLANLESFIRSAEMGGFSAAARRLALTPAAVSRNVAMLERNLGVRLFQRSTRKLTLTEAGERFLLAIRDHLEGLQAAIGGIATDRGEPAGVLKVSMGLTFGVVYICPCCRRSLRAIPASARLAAREPAGGPDRGRVSTPRSVAASSWTPGVVARLAPQHHRRRLAAYLRGRTPPPIRPGSLGRRDRHALPADRADPRPGDAQRRRRGDGGAR